MKQNRKEGKKENKQFFFSIHSDSESVFSKVSCPLFNFFIVFRLFRRSGFLCFDIFKFSLVVIIGELRGKREETT